MLYIKGFKALDDNIHKNVKKDAHINNLEILWRDDLVYVFKLVVVVILYFSALPKDPDENFLMQLLYIVPIFIDCIIAGKFVKNNIKGFIYFHTFFTAFILIGLVYIFLLHTKFIPVNTLIFYCRIIFFDCCF